MNKLGLLSRYTECAFERIEFKGRVTMVQTAFIEKIIEYVDVTSGRSIPSDPCLTRGPKRDEEPGGNWPFWQAMGYLMWVADLTRPDIANANRDVARYDKSPSVQYCDTVPYILRYVRGTRILSVTFEKGRGLNSVG